MFKRDDAAPLIFLAAAGTAIAASAVITAHWMNGTNGFPVDDAWIHLQFARNIRDYGSFSYFRDQQATAGSTSPLYTLLLAAGFLFTSNEFVLSYVLGCGFLAASALFMYRLASRLWNDTAAAIGAALLLAAEPRLLWAAGSGMETTLFIALFLITLDAWLDRAPHRFGISAGLLLWARPDAVFLYGALAADLAYRAWTRPRTPVRKGRQTETVSEPIWWLPALKTFVPIVLAYGALNLWLSGTILPNTYAAKIKYYSEPAKTFWTDLRDFIFTPPLILPLAFALIALLQTLVSIVRRTGTPLLVPFLFALLMILAYWKNLPKLYQHGRYMMPLFPVLMLAAAGGAVTTAHWVHRIVSKRLSRLSQPVITASIFAVPLCLLLGGMRATYADYAENCRYITDRQVAAGQWMAEHLPQQAVVATHDIGAIGYYSKRRIVDMVGLVSPGMIEGIGSFPMLVQFLERQQATHIAVLRNWFELTNVTPVFSTDPSAPEIVEVFPLDLERIHFAPQNITRANDAAEFHLSRGNAVYAFEILKQTVQADPASARGHALMAQVLFALGDTARGRAELAEVIRLQPDSPAARRMLGAFQPPQ